MIKDPVTHEINLMYMLARVVDTMLADIESRLRARGDSYKGEPKRRLKEFTHLVQQSGAHFMNFIEPQILKCVDGDWKQYEISREYANEMIRLLMLYYEVCSRSTENHVKVFDFISELGDEGHRMGVFDSEDINRFSLGCDVK